MRPRYPEALAGTNEVYAAHDNAEIIRNVFEAQTRDKLFNPIEDPSATDALKDQIEAWKQDGDVVVAVFGGFDAPFHINHQQFLLDCKAHGVPLYYERNHAAQTGFSWEELEQPWKDAYIKGALADGKIKMVVSTDGDQRIADSKGFNPNKGGSPRPLQGWATRAHSLSTFSLQLNGNAYVRTPVVDAVTVHDHLALPGTIHADPVDMVATLKPDVWTLFHEAERDISVASIDARLSGAEMFVIQGDDYKAIDPLTGEPFSTTALVRRIKGE